MSAFIRCIHCNVIFMQPNFYLLHNCAGHPAAQHMRTRLQQSIDRHPSQPSGDAS